MFALVRRNPAVLPVVMLLSIAAVLAGCSRSPQEREARHLRRGIALMERKDYSRALLEFQNAAKAMPTHAEPYYQSGLAYLATNNVRAAVPLFYKATQLDPKHAGAQLKLATMMATSGDKAILEQAQKRIQEVLAGDPDNPRALDTLAIATFKLGKPDEAEALIEQALKASPADLQSAQMLAQMKLRRRDTAGAEAALKQAGSNAPKSADAALTLGRFYMVMGKPEQAEGEIRRALQLNPKFAAALFSLALLQTQNSRIDQAEQSYRQLSMLPEKDFQPLYGRFLFGQGKRDAAIAEFKRLAAKDPADRSVRSLLVAAYVESGRVQDAENTITAALKRNPKDTDALLQHSELRLRAGDAASAEKDLLQVLRFRPDSADAHFMTARVQRIRGMAQRERQELGEALRLNPLHLDSRVALARNYMLAREAKSAVDLMNGTPAQQRNNAAAVAVRNWALLASGEYAEARLRIDDALRASRAPEFRLQDATLKLVQRDFAGARAAAEELLNQNPGDIRAVRVMADSYAAEKQPLKAVERVRSLVAQRPNSADLQIVFGQMLMAVNNAPEARKTFEAAAALSGGSTPARLLLARLDMSENRMDAARKGLDTILGGEPRNFAALLMLAELEERSGNAPAAIARYRSALEINGSHAIALNNLAYLLAPDKPDEALKFAQQALQVAPDSAAIQDTVGWVYYRKGIYSSAVEYLKKAVATDPTPRHQFHLAVSYLKVGERDLGQRTLAAALKLDPSLAKTEQGW